MDVQHHVRDDVALESGATLPLGTTESHAALNTFGYDVRFEQKNRSAMSSSSLKRAMAATELRR
jgi:alpha-D-ribose 1-methylphosphonate 5-triphosphate synthase subunit PhnI